MTGDLKKPHLQQNYQSCSLMIWTSGLKKPEHFFLKKNVVQVVIGSVGII